MGPISHSIKSEYNFGTLGESTPFQPRRGKRRRMSTNRLGNYHVYDITDFDDDDDDDDAFVLEDDVGDDEKVPLLKDDESDHGRLVELSDEEEHGQKYYWQSKTEFSRKIKVNQVVKSEHTTTPISGKRKATFRNSTSDLPRFSTRGIKDECRVKDECRIKDDYCSIRGDEEEDFIHSDNVPMQPDPIPSSSAHTIDRTLQDFMQDIKIKKEGSDKGLSEEERSKRNARLQRWIMANTDPDDGLGRFVFKRGCAKRCITTVLGGSGMYPWPIVTQPPLVKFSNSNQQEVENPFIKPGEYYVAGNEAFNPFGPRFPGDFGCVDIRSLSMNENQKEFHVFVQCAQHSTSRLWHGKGARGGRLYVGVYKRHDENGPYCNEILKFKTLQPEKKRVIAKFFYDTDIQRYKREWPNLADKERVEKLIQRLDKNFESEFVPVQFVRYDEDLYRALKECGAAMKREDRSGRVTINPCELAQH